MKKLNIRIKTDLNFGILHDSRADVNTLAKALQKAADKIDELIDEVENLKYGKRTNK